MEELGLFILSFIFVLLIYQIFIIIPAKKRKNNKSKGRKKKEDTSKELFEIKYLQARYKLDMKKINYNQLLQICAITSSFDISFIVYLIGIINNFILRVLGGFIFTLGIIMLSYHLVYLFYKKKGMIINE
ncbi:MAG: hypothetical protein PUG33_06815 [Mollicutes bacterium]|nr:hypothetical protein [Mollicutes bacterium]MDY5875923.1 hypothetical protein [Bacilli bacterium]